MHENKKGYYIYSTFVVLFFVFLFGFVSYLIYDLIIKLSAQDFSDNTLLQALFTLFATVFIGGFFTKILEYNNHRKIELYKIKTSISLKVIDLASDYCHKPSNDNIKNLLIRESSKIKLYFKDEVLLALNNFINAENENKDSSYELLINSFKIDIK